LRIFSKNIGITSRCEGKIEDDSTVTIMKILCYDIVSSPGFDTEEFKNEIYRQKLMKERKEKLDRLNRL